MRTAREIACDGIVRLAERRGRRFRTWQRIAMGLLAIAAVLLLFAGSWLVNQLLKSHRAEAAQLSGVESTPADITSAQD